MFDVDINRVKRYLSRLKNQIGTSGDNLDDSDLDGIIEDCDALVSVQLKTALGSTAFEALDSDSDEFKVGRLLVVWHVLVEVLISVAPDENRENIALYWEKIRGAMKSLATVNIPLENGGVTVRIPETSIGLQEISDGIMEDTTLIERW